MIDLHVHIKLPNEEYYTISKNTVSDVLEYIYRANLDYVYAFLDPSFTRYVCPNFLNKKHKTKLCNGQLICAECGKIIYSSKDDIYHKYNIKLLDLLANTKNILPLIFLEANKDTITKEVDFFEKEYSNRFFGYKIYPRLISQNMTGIDFNSKKPVLIHGVNDDKEYLQSIIDFAKRYKGNVIIAHLARLPEWVWQQINSITNLYGDLSPFLETCKFDKIDKISERFNLILKRVNLNKILFGTDFGYSNTTEEIEFIRSNLDAKVLKKITSTNIKKVFRGAL